MRHRTHCERRGGLGGNSEPRGRSEDGAELMASPHLVHTEAGGGGRGQHGNSVSNMSNNNMAAGALLGVVSHGQGQVSGMFAGLAMGRNVCQEDVCDVRANGGGSVT